MYTVQIVLSELCCLLTKHKMIPSEIKVNSLSSNSGPKRGFLAIICKYIYNTLFWVQRSFGAVQRTFRNEPDDSSKLQSWPQWSFGADFGKALELTLVKLWSWPQWSFSAVLGKASELTSAKFWSYLGLRQSFGTGFWIVPLGFHTYICSMHQDIIMLMMTLTYTLEAVVHMALIWTEGRCILTLSTVNACGYDGQDKFLMLVGCTTRFEAQWG